MCDNDLMEIDLLARYGGTAVLRRVLGPAGIRELYPPQVLALEAGLLKTRESLVVAAPTASGKTFIAEMALLQAFLDGQGKTLYLVPLKALAREKFEEFTRRYAASGLKVMLSTGDLDRAEPWLHQADLAIATNEKLDSLIRHRAPWLRELTLVVADEVHLLRDPHRGPTLEVVLTRLRALNPRLRFIALSATIPNAQEIAGWLEARLVQSAWRPVPLREGVYFNGAAIFNDGTVKWVPEESGLDAVDLALETVDEGGQALIFVNTRKSTEVLAARTARYIGVRLSASAKEALGRTAEEVLLASSEPTHICRKLAEAVQAGVAFHHAGILAAQRKLVEDAFRENRLKCVVATTTLAMGLNLPSRRVIIRDWWRYSSGLGMQPIPAIEIKQMGGRAGRPSLDPYGESVLVARDRRDEKELFQTYIRGELEKIRSQLGSEAALRTHILASIAGEFAADRGELQDFLGDTFFAYQSGSAALEGLAERILAFLEEEKMVQCAGDRLQATRFGRRVSQLYIDPLTGAILRNAFQGQERPEPFALLHLTARTPDMMTLSLRKRDREAMLKVFQRHARTLLLSEEEKIPTEERLAEIKTASALMEWIEERPEDEIVEDLGIGPGDLRTLVELGEWLLYAAGEIARLFKKSEAVQAATELRVRVAYGVREELLELVSLRGIGRVRARNLYRAGFRSLQDIRGATPEVLSRVPALGPALAADIFQQAGAEEEERRPRQRKGERSTRRTAVQRGPA